VLRYLEHVGPGAVLEEMAPVVGRYHAGLKPSLRGVCFVAPEIDRIGGYELATLALARELREHGVSVLVVTITTGELNAAGDAGLIRIQVRGRHILLSTFPRLLAILARERSKYSIIHCSTFGYISGLAVLAGRILRCPTVLRVATENDVREFAEGRTFKTQLFFNILRRATGAIAPSRAIREELLTAGFSNDQIIVLPNAVDVVRFQPATLSEKVEAKSALGLCAESLVIGTVARLVQRKRIDILLRAFGKVIHSYRTRLLVVGDGPLRDELRTAARGLGIDGYISWVGFQNEPAKLLRAMDVFALPSQLEGSPNVVLEAMAMGLPVIATRIGGIVDLIEENTTGILIRPGDADELAIALRGLLSDAGLRASLGLAARSRAVEVFSLSRNVQRLIDLYLAACDQKTDSNSA
jgi:glycosyltransferase involved in cell wall biosynthesis